MITENMPWWKKRLVEQTGGGKMDKKRKGVKEPNSWFNDFVKKKTNKVTVVGMFKLKRII